ncbi:MAG: DNA internalization-related competence protein ComEC/Rec2 [Defluviitaleaceae bacterium]|nr:DNA internalization-related competence protein ComEC/Rec2 [Defluviitaleaceae bacterium]
MARPTIWIFIFLASGILFSYNFGFNMWLVVLCAAAIILSGLIYLIYKRKIAFALPFFALLGTFLVHIIITPNDDVLEKVALQEGFVRATGVVQDISLTRAGNQRVLINTSSFAIGASQQPHYSNLLIQAFLPEGADVVLGQHIVASGYLHTLEGVRNPGGFNEFQFLRSRGIEYRLFAESVEVYEINMTWAMHIRSFGLRLSKVFHEVLPADMAGIMSAMIVGDRSGLDMETRDMYSSAGMFHILVVSGLHVNILALFFSKALNFLGVKDDKKRGIATIGFIILFAIMTGAGVATIRASIMGITLILAGILGYQNDSTTSLGIAATIILLSQPLFLFDIGFIYSFTTVLALIYLSPPIKKILPKPIAKDYVATTLAATVVYTIISSYMSFEFSPYVVLTNLLLLPTVFVVVVLGLILSLVGLISTGLAYVVAMPVWALLSFYEFVMNLTLSLPFSTILTGRPTTLTIIALLILIIAFIKIINKSKNMRKRLFVAFSAISAIFIFQITFNALNPTITTTFLYVGQGDSTIISRGQNAIIIDGGGPFGREIGQSSGTFNLMPYLSYRGVSKATAIITHNHSDHAIGIIEAMQAGRINHLIMAKANSVQGNYTYDLLVETANNMQIPISYISAGYQIGFGGMQLDVIFPYDERTMQGENNASLVILATHNNHKILLTGDIEAAVEAYISTSAYINAHIIKIPHHGSRSSSTQPFLNAVNPQFAVISAGRNSMFNHPHTEVINRLDENGINWANTATHGAITVRTNGRNMRVQTMMRGN